jgi:hypothetical protein
VPCEISGRVYREDLIEQRQQSYGEILSPPEGTEKETSRASVQTKQTGADQFIIGTTRGGQKRDRPLRDLPVTG